MVAPRRTTGSQGLQTFKTALFSIFLKRRKYLFVVTAIVLTLLSTTLQSKPTIFLEIDKEVQVNVVVVSSHPHPTHYPQPTTTTTKIIRDKKATAAWRDEAQSNCRSVLHRVKTQRDEDAIKQKEKVERISLEKIQSPHPHTVSEDPPTPHKIYDDGTCENAFFDLGTNIGDTIGYFVNAALDVCTPLWRNVNPNIPFHQDWFPRPQLNVSSLEFHTSGETMNPALAFLQWAMAEGWEVLPEDMCVFGVEGNPRFTKRLQKLENFLQATEPPLFQHLHIHTETVITKVNGPTQLFLDEHSVEHNVSTAFDYYYCYWVVKYFSPS
jgi:hypothetical protein